MGWLSKWWVQPDHFRWLSGYLGYRNVRGFTGRMMAAVVASLGAVPILIMLSPAGPTTVVGRVLSLFVTVCCAVMATMWLTRWPSRRQSVLFVLMSNACVTISCLVYAGLFGSLLACTTFAALAGYVAFFHTSRHLALVLLTAAATSTFCAVELATAKGSVPLALANLIIIAVAVLAVPFSVHVLVHLLGDDALKSHTDPLTGLRNRRGFYRSARELIDASVGAAEPYLTVIMVDLDRFKEVNDTRGHATGDRILVAVADKLRRATRGRAVVARVGGEEFVIAETTKPGEAYEIAERLREELAAIPWGVTASLGVANAALVDTYDLETRAAIEQLVEAADTAMYEAKRAGGNQSRQAESAENGAPVRPIH